MKQASVFLTGLCAGRLDNEFAAKSFVEQYKAVRRFCIANAITIRAATHVSQARPQDTTDLALGFVRAMRPWLIRPVNRRPFILNMD